MTLLYTHSQSLSIPSFLSTIHGVYLNKCVSRLHPWLSLSESLPGGQVVMQHSPSLIQSRLWIYLGPFNLTHPTLLTNEGREVGRTVRSPSSSVFPNPIHYAEVIDVLIRINKYFLSDLMKWKTQHQFLFTERHRKGLMSSFTGFVQLNFTM